MKNFDIIFRSCNSGCITRIHAICADSMEEAEAMAEAIWSDHESDYDSWYEIKETRA